MRKVCACIIIVILAVIVSNVSCYGDDRAGVSGSTIAGTPSRAEGTTADLLAQGSTRAQATTDLMNMVEVGTIDPTAGLITPANTGIAVTANSVLGQTNEVITRPAATLITGEAIITDELILDPNQVYNFSSLQINGLGSISTTGSGGSAAGAGSTIQSSVTSNTIVLTESATTLINNQNNLEISHFVHGQLTKAQINNASAFDNKLARDRVEQNRQQVRRFIDGESSINIRRFGASRNIYKTVDDIAPPQINREKVRGQAGDGATITGIFTETIVSDGGAQ